MSRGERSLPESSWNRSCQSRAVFCPLIK
eukprot:gene26697-biopygen17166